MSKKFKSQASSARAASSAFGTTSFAFGSTSSTSSLSYIAEQPDLSTISDPNVIVSLRNLSKKDSTTKSKALEELQEHVKVTGSQIEDAVISAWVDLYPRTSIDNARRVRQLAHALQGSFTIASGKRIAPRLSKVVGAWLCGVFDNDRSVARAASEALGVAFSTQERRQALWKLYKDSLLEYAEDAILVQTASTLSDERSTSKDDAEAKHARVVGSAITMLGHLITSNVDNAAFREKIIQTVSNKSLWDNVNSNDPYLRRSTCTLAIQCTETFRDDLDWQVMSSRFLSKGLHADQLGSAVTYSEALLVLTRVRPEIWTSDYTGKTTALKRLCQYLRQGSHRGTEIVWRNNTALLRHIPLTVLAGESATLSLENANLVAHALFNGVTNQDEPRPNLPVGWMCYIELVFWLQSLLQTANERFDFVSEHLVPVLSRYVEGSRDGSTFPAAAASRLASDMVKRLANSDLQPVLAEAWSSFATALVEKMRLSLPETSKDFKSSQEAVAAQSSRLFKLKPRVTADDDLTATLASADKDLLNNAIDLLRNRNGKPYGAAAVLLDVVSQRPVSDQDVQLQSFLEKHVPSLLQSPSADRLVSIWKLSGRPLAPLLEQCAAGGLTDDGSNNALNALISTASAEDVNDSPQLTTLLMTTRDRSVVKTLLSNTALASTSLVDAVLKKITLDLSADSASLDQLQNIQLLTQAVSSTEAQTTVKMHDQAGDIFAQLLFLTDSANSEVADAAKSLLSILKSDTNGVSSDPSTTLNLVVNQLSGARPQISILSLADLAAAEFQNASDKPAVAQTLLPTIDQWQVALEPHFRHKRPSALGITSSLQGTVYTLEASSSQSSQILHDAEDFSQAFRLAIYVTKLFEDATFSESASLSDPSALHHYLPIVLQLTNEKLSLDSANELWLDSTPEVVDEAADVLSQGNGMITTWMATEDSSFTSDWLVKIADLQGNKTESYVLALALADIASRFSEKDGGSALGAQFDAQVKQLHHSHNILQSAAIACSAREYLVSSSTGRRALNELISSATELRVDSLTLETMQPLVLLNIVLNGDSSALDGIPSQRLVFLMQNLTRLLSAATLDMLVESEIFKLLACVLPAVEEIYGDHWQEILESLVSTWTELNDADGDLPTLNATLRLYQKLKGMAASEDANEDLQDAWKANRAQLEASLLQCLHLLGQPSDGPNAPRQICASLLGRLLCNAKVDDIKPIIPLMSSSSEAVLDTAYSILHHAIPARQEQLSVDLVLEKQVLHLPPELLDLLQDDIQTRVSKKRYLLTWKLIFDHYQNASYRLKEMYTADLKEGGQLPLLLDSICTAIRIVDNRPVDASKYDFQSFTPGTSESDDKELTWLNIHLYYCSLLYTPGLVKAWYIEQKNRIKTPLEAWTQKHLSSAIVAASFDTVVQWSKTQDAEDSPVEVKANVRSFDLVASMPIDPESPPISIAVVLPQAYPLDSPTVVSKTRVAVSEKNWQSWLRTIQIIIFSTGSIIEGLVAFRRNVQGALKGQGECAICYSIIGTDMQTPNKKCGTCKNMFHGACLFRWFKSSNSSTCPLCRNSFSYA